MLEILVVIHGFIMLYPEIGLVTTLIGSYLLFVYHTKQQDKIKMIKDKYHQRDLKRIKEVMDSIVVRTFSQVDGKLASTCIDVQQQKDIYYYILDSVFNNHVYYMVKKNVIENGFHDLNHKELEDYIELKAMEIYEFAILKIKMLVGGKCPCIKPIIGQNFGVANAIKFYENIIDNVLDNEKKCLIEIKKTDNVIDLIKKIKKEL